MGIRILFNNLIHVNMELKIILLIILYTEPYLNRHFYVFLQYSCIQSILLYFKGSQTSLWLDFIIAISIVC